MFVNSLNQEIKLGIDPVVKFRLAAQFRGLDKGFGFAKIIIVNLTAFLRLGGRRQFFYDKLVKIHYYLGAVKRRLNDIAYLVSSDTDLVAAVEEVQSIGKTVQYVGIPKGQSFGLSKVANDVRLLRTEEIEQFFTKI